MERLPELMTAESALLFACAQARPDRAARARIDALLREEVRWEPLLAAAALHDVLPLLHASLAAAESERVPAAVRRRLHEAARANVHHALYLAAELRRLLALSADAGHTAIPFKGPVLAAAAYGDLTLRQFTDLDLFVRKSELAAIARLLLGAGYRSDTHDGVEATQRSLAGDADVAYRDPSYYAFYRADGRCRVDLQWRMADRFFAFSLDGGGVEWDFEDVPFGGRTVRTFAPTDTLLILCVHGAKHQFEKLKWVCDIAETIRAGNDRIDWDALHRKAGALHAGRMVGLGLALAQDVLGARLPETVSRRLHADRALAGLVRERRAALAGASPSAPVKTRPLAFYLRTKDGWRDQARFCATYARQFAARVVTPNERDTAWVALPPRLAPLYYVLRPMRVLATYVGRAPRTQASSPDSTAPTHAPETSLAMPPQSTTMQGDRPC